VSETLDELVVLSLQTCQPAVSPILSFIWNTRLNKPASNAMN